MSERKPTVTFLDLVRAVQDFAGSDREVVAVLTYLFRSGKILRPRAFHRSLLASR